MLDLADQAARGVARQTVRLNDLVFDGRTGHPGLTKVDDLDDDRDELDGWKHVRESRGAPMSQA